MVRVLTILMISLNVSSCATSYSRLGFKGGFTEVKLDDNVYKVSYNGNGFTSSNQVTDMLLMRCADITLLNKQKYFTVINADTEVNESIHLTNPSSLFPGGLHTVRKVSKTAIIETFTEKPRDKESFNAKVLCDSIGSLYSESCDALTTDR